MCLWFVVLGTPISLPHIKKGESAMIPIPIIKIGFFIIFAVFIATIAMIINALKSALIYVRCGLFMFLKM